MRSHLRIVHDVTPLAMRAIELTDQAGEFQLAYGRYLGARFALISATPEDKPQARAACDAARDRFAEAAAVYVAMAKRYDDLI